ncbi:oligopeptide/dipeptide ABC transporter ATP-binding protein [Roseococcus sp. DSY-14]|uniref:oligopeptide/dipeptide ABC transporter ATP-binding protein n=1 Tax=Roseococcus sp. DSY-14 TaxID=3369650 RepID=UPI00387AA456
MTPLLEVEALHKRFPIGGGGWLSRRAPAQLHAVEDVSFTLEAGATLGLVGESGCGKSTLARLLARLLDPSEGGIRLRGESIGAVPAARFGASPARASIQMVFQDAEGSINPRHTAFEAIARPLRRLSPLRGGALHERVVRTAALCGLPAELLGRFPHQLSGGQKARVGIARAVATEPALLVLDEPTSALDVSVQVVILGLLKALQARTGAAFIFVSHDLNVVRLLCDRVLVMYLGRVVEEGPAEALFTAPAHPYTRALVGAVTGAPVRLEGEPRSPIDPDPDACRFHGRCPVGQAVCARQAPPVHQLPGGRRVACHFPLTTGTP